MNVKVHRDELRAALGAVGSAVAGKTAMPILANVLLRTTDTGLVVAATDLSLGVSVAVEATVVTPGDTTVPARLFTELVNNLPNATIYLSYNKDTNTLTVDCDRYSSNIATLPANEYPYLPTAGEATLTVPASVFCDAVSKVVIAAATDDSRPVLTGIYLTASGYEMTLVGADGFRLAWHRITLAEPVAEVTALIPARTLAHVAKVMRDDDTISMSFNSTNHVFFNRKVLVMSRILDGKFPDISRFLTIQKGESSPSFTVNKKALQQAIKIASLMTINNLVVLNVFNNLEVTARGSQMGTNRTVIEVERSGNDTMIAVNAGFLSDALWAIPDETVTLWTASGDGANAMTPLMVHGTSSQYLHIVMPMTYK